MATMQPDMTELDFAREVVEEMAENWINAGCAPVMLLGAMAEFLHEAGVADATVEIHPVH